MAKNPNPIIVPCHISEHIGGKKKISLLKNEITKQGKVYRF